MVVSNNNSHEQLQLDQRLETNNHENELLSKRRAVTLIMCITCITAIGNLLAGLLTVCIPVISIDLSIPPDLQLWPASAFALACGCTLLPCGAIVDVVGCRRTCLFGALLQTACAVGAGLSQTSTQLIGMRTAAGVAASFCLPSAVAVASHCFPSATSPTMRNAAFAAMGAGQAVGFGLGLVIGGLCTDWIGWRWGFYGTSVLNGLLFALSFWALRWSTTMDDEATLDATVLTRLAQNIDWVGALIITTSLALLSYELAVATGSGADTALHQPLNVLFLCIGLVLLLCFFFWMQHRERNDRPALIPNSLWLNGPFVAVCITVFFVWGGLNASEQLIALYLQDVREKSALTSSLYFLPAPIVGVLVNMFVGFSLPYLRPSLAVPTACAVSGVASLLLAILCRVDGPDYWQALFPATALNPLGADLIYTIAILVTTAAFPTKTQALAGSVFHMLSQIGKSVGIATTAVIARRIAGDEDTKNALVTGFKAGWWYNASLGFAAVVVSSWGLRSVKELGLKRD